MSSKLRGALNRKPQEPPPRKRVFNEEKERTLLAMAQGSPPEGRASWTLQLLAEELVRLEIVEATPAAIALIPSRLLSPIVANSSSLPRVDQRRAVA